MLGQIVMAVSPDGSDVERLVRRDPGRVTVFDWSPDGRAILAGLGFGRPRPSCRSSTATARGPGALDLGPTFIAYAASWRPDGRHIAFLGEEEDLDRVAFIADADGTEMYDICRSVPSTLSGPLRGRPTGSTSAFDTATTASPGASTSLMSTSTAPLTRSAPADDRPGVALRV